MKKIAREWASQPDIVILQAEFRIFRIIFVLPVLDLIYIR